MASKKGRNLEKCKIYKNRDTREKNKIRKAFRHEQRILYFKNRSNRFNEIIPAEVDKYLTFSITNSYIGQLSAKTHNWLIAGIANDISDKKNLPVGRVKQFLRKRLPSPA